MASITATTPLWIAAGTLLTGQGKEFFTHWRKAGASFGVDEIHDFRVASRRLREGLALFAPCFPGKDASRLGKKIKHLTQLLGTMRNTDEAIILFSELSEAETRECREETEQLIATLTRERESVSKELRRELRSLDPAPLRSAFRALRRHPKIFGPVEVDPFQPITNFAEGAIGARELAVRELIPQAKHEEQAEAQHRLRIAVKHLRYRLEILEPLLGDDFARLHQGLKRYQDLLGKLHDLDVFADLARERLSETAGREQLLEVLSARRKALHAAFCRLLKETPLKSIGEQARAAL
ncbi:CHAD domain-containing protein [Geomesophilobacter sediminis]|uniref:CHAD domain-containing protein n=1 Tax=Geomesophilobacter sediminis TaxID=2798584 RepID=A0A8J7LUR7_9BACT|nr:CHAD domain-containing protein [Geomesophilobacter sediminis]MBJ6724964.1 CHAD domain-containing protein [Geomesophilobacter sediminis]